MKWYSQLYVGEKAKKKKNTIIRKLKINAGMRNVYVITRASNSADLFDIISTVYLKQRTVRRNLPTIIGIAIGYEEALELVIAIIQETYRETGDVKVHQYLAEKVKRNTLRQR